MMAQSMTRQARVARPTDFRFVVGEGSDDVVLKFDTPAKPTEFRLTKGQLERLAYEADNAVGKLKCREKLAGTP